MFFSDIKIPRNLKLNWPQGFSYIVCDTVLDDLLLELDMCLN